MAVISKHFTTHKRGENDEDIQDSICINEENGRFALSDGVSQSFLPRILADILTEAYVNATDDISFPPSDLPEIFKNRRDAYFSTRDEFGNALQELVEEDYKTGAATFVGLEFRGGHVSWKVIGDSCLFIIPDDGNIQCICSEKVTVDASGSIHVAFGNHPAQIQSNGNVYGHFITGSIQKACGWYILMSDAISMWFIERYNKGFNEAQKLFSLDGNGAFEILIEEEYQAKRIKSDDCSVILIRVENEDTEVKDKDKDKDSTSIDYPTRCVLKSIIKPFLSIFKKRTLTKSLCNNDNQELH